MRVGKVDGKAATAGQLLLLARIKTYYFRKGAYLDGGNHGEDGQCGNIHVVLAGLCVE